MSLVLKKSFDILKKNSAITMILFIGFFVMLFFMFFVTTRILVNGIASLVFVISVLGLTVAFYAGWFNAIKFAADNMPITDKSDDKYLLKMSKYNSDTVRAFFSGVSEYFVSIFIFSFLIFLIFWLILLLGQKILSAYTIDWVNFLNMLKTSDVDIIASQLSPQEMKSISVWNGYFNIATFILGYFILYWVPAIYYKAKNPIKALLYEGKYLLKNPLQSIGFYLYTLVCSFTTSLLVLIFQRVFLISLIFYVLLFYVTGYILLISFIAFKHAYLNEEVKKMNEKDVFIKSSDMENTSDDNSKQ